jgi:hypothetical protein
MSHNDKLAKVLNLHENVLSMETLASGNYFPPDIFFIPVTHVIRLSLACFPAEASGRAVHQRPTCEQVIGLEQLTGHFQNVMS